MNQKYEINLYWSKVDHVFVAEVPELPGCMAHGNSRESALANVNESVAFWIATANEFGRAVPAPRDGWSPYA